MRYLTAFLILLSGCSHRLILVYESEQAAQTQSRFYFNPEGASVFSAPIPKLPEAKNETLTPSNLFAPGRNPL